MAATDPPCSSTDPAHVGAGDGPGKRDFWQQTVIAAATAAGSVAWVSAVGSGIMALRLGNADLPIEPVVALMSPEHRFAVGAGTLAGPLLAGLFAAVLEWIVVRWTRIDDEQRRHLALATVAISAPIAYLLLRPPAAVFAAQTVTVAIAVWVALKVLTHDRHSFQERITVFLAVLVSVGAVGVAAERIGPTVFYAASITVTGDSRAVEGGYVTSTDYAVLMVPARAECPMIEAVPRAQIVRIEVSHTPADTPDC